VRLLVLALLLVPVGALAHPSAAHKVATLSELIRAHPEEPRLYIERGAAYSEDGRDELALVDFETAAALGEPVLAAFELGVLHYRAGRLDAAKASFDTFLARYPGHPPSLEYQARLLRDAGQYEDSLASFRAYFATRESPNPGDYVSAARMLASLEAEGSGEAIAMLDEGMVRLGVIPQLQRSAIAFELERGNLAAAIGRLASLKPALRSSPAWKLEMGELLLRAGRPAEADPLFREATRELASLRRTPARQRALDRLGELAADGSGVGRASSDAAPKLPGSR
jgi:tetratricopeptide (TPR) repeat protein